MRPAGLALVSIAVATAAGCGFGVADDDSGGHRDLPTTGAGPFRRLPTDLDTPVDEPWLVTDLGLDVTEPELLPRPGGGIRFFITREPADVPIGDTPIWLGAVADFAALPDEPPAPVLVADQPWEEGRVGAPAVVALADRLVLFYEGGAAAAPAIGRAESTDGGRTWHKRAEPVLAGARAPGAAFDGSTWLLAATRPDAPGIWLARSTDGETFALDPAPILVARPELGDAFDSTAVASPCLRWLVESSGRGHWALWYGGLEEAPDPGDAPRYAVGYAASFDGADWQRPAGGRPVLSQPAGAPAVLVDGTRATLLYDAYNSRRPSVGVATHP